jgi:hypothetical protein
MCIITNEVFNEFARQEQTRQRPAFEPISNFANIDPRLFKEADVETLKSNFSEAFVTSEQLISEEIYCAIAYRSGATPEQLSQLKDNVRNTAPRCMHVHTAPRCIC